MCNFNEDHLWWPLQLLSASVTFSLLKHLSDKYITYSLLSFHILHFISLDRFCLSNLGAHSLVNILYFGLFVVSNYFLCSPGKGREREPPKDRPQEVGSSHLEDGEKGKAGKTPEPKVYV